MITALFTAGGGAAGGAMGALVGGVTCLPTGPGALVCAAGLAAAGAAAGAEAGAYVGSAVDLGIQIAKMAQAGKGRGANRSENAEVDRIVKQYDLNRAGQRALHDQITGQNYTGKEIEDIAAELAQQRKYLLNPPPQE